MERIKKRKQRKVMWILLKKVLEEKISNEKYRVVLRQWKKLQLPKRSMLK